MATRQKLDPLSITPYPAIYQAVPRYLSPQVATKQKLDLTDAFEEAAGKGRDASTGVMAKNRFATCLGLMFKGDITKQAMTAICSAYGAGDPDPREPGTFVQVQL